MRNTAKMFICHHPGQLLLYKNLIQIVKKHDKDIKILLFRVNHPYFSEFNFKPYNQFFDKIIELDFIHYQKNFLTGFWKIFNFQNKLKKINNSLLLKFDKIDLFLHDSAWLPVNLLLYNLSQQKNIKNITIFSLGELENSQTKNDRLKTFLCNLYSLFFKCYKVKVISTKTGKFYDFVYADQVAGNTVKIVNPASQQLNYGEKNVLFYPIIKKYPQDIKKDMVIVFGDANIIQYHSEHLPKYEIFIKEITKFFETLASKYSDCRLYYKPHPSDKGRIMPGINVQRYNLLDDTMNAEIILDNYNQKIKAVYTFSSTSVVVGSFFAIPSYTFYRYLLDHSGAKMLDDFFSQNNMKSNFLFHISNLGEIGKVDDLQSVDYCINLENVDKKYLKVLNI